MIKDIASALFKPVTDILRVRQERKAAKEAAHAKLLAAKVDGQQQLALNRDEYELLRIPGLDNTWKDEYATVSVLSIFNLILLGGILSAFGYPSLLQGVGEAIRALHELGVDVGLLLEAVVFSALGLSVLKRV